MKIVSIAVAALASLLLAPAVLAQEHSATTHRPGQTNEVFQPIDLAKNPYQLNGHSGILDTGSTPILMPGGRAINLIPWPSMRFEKMLDEHTALYEVMAYEDGAMMPQCELAVIVSDSTPPNLARRWRVHVEGQINGWNGYGVRISIAAVRFEGYYVPPPPTAEQLAEQAARHAEQERQHQLFQEALQKQQQEQQAQQEKQKAEEAARKQESDLETARIGELRNQDCDQKRALAAARFSSHSAKLALKQWIDQYCPAQP